MKTLVIIPAFNEEGSIVHTMEDLKKHAPDFDYLIINDSSEDDTLRVCRENRYHYLNLPVNLGIGGAVQTGYRFAYYQGYDLAVQFDGDGQHRAEYLSVMKEKMMREHADMVIGSRFIRMEGYQSSYMRRIGIRYFSLLIRLVTGCRITDPTSGMRMVNRKLLQKFMDDYPKDYPEPESVTDILTKKYKVCEIPVEMNGRNSGTSSISMISSIYYMVKVSLAIVITACGGG